MTWILERVRSEDASLWREFVAVYMFGSAIECNMPDDVDLLLIYEDGIEWERIGREKARIMQLLGAKLHGLDVHATTLGMTELSEARILELVEARRIFCRNQPTKKQIAHVRRY